MINFMRGSDSPYLADWFAISLRWLTLLGITIALSTQEAVQFSSPLMLVLFLGGVWNVAMSFLAILNVRVPYHRVINVIVDVVIGTALFITSGGFFGSISWVGLLILFPAAIYYELQGALLVGLLVWLLQMGSSLAMYSGFAWAPALLIGLFNLGCGFLFGWLSKRLIFGVRVNRNTQAQARRANDSRVQQQERDRIRAFYKLTMALSSTLDYQRVLDTALDLTGSTLDDRNASSDRIVSAVLQFSDNDHQLHVGSARRLTPADTRNTLPGVSGVIGQAIQTGDPVVTDDPGKDPELSRLVAFRVCQCAYVLPLRSGLNVYGVMVFGYPDAGYFTPERCEILEIISQQSVIAIQNARLYQDLETEKERILESQEEARKKLARDLHDGPTQSVAAIAMRINFTRRLLDKDVKSAANELIKIEDLARSTTKEIRHMLFTLRPLALESQGLVPALEAMAVKMKETFDQNVLIDIDPAVVNDLEITKQSVVFFLIEEAVNNARKYAKAAHIWVRLKYIPQEKGLAMLEVADDGQGFDVQAVTRSYEGRGSLGMVNLTERTEMINGLLQMDSAPGKGTRVRVVVPLTAEAADRLQNAR